MKRGFRSIIRFSNAHGYVILMIAVVTVLLWPAPTHAQGFTADLISGVARMVADIPSIFLGLIGTAIGAVGKGISIIVTLPLAADNAVVRGVWVLLRNVCNMVFLLALIIMAFATIFQVPFGRFRAYAFQSAFQYFLIAAILLNFSLALGVLLVRGTDVVNDLIVRIMPKDIGDQISQQLNSFSNTIPSANTPEGKAADAS